MVKRKGKYLAYKVPEGKEKFMALIEKGQMYEIIGLLADLGGLGRMHFQRLFNIPNEEFKEWLIIKKI